MCFLALAGWTRGPRLTHTDGRTDGDQILRFPRETSHVHPSRVALVDGTVGTSAQCGGSRSAATAEGSAAGARFHEFLLCGHPGRRLETI